MSTLRFRNLNVTPADPVEAWGVEGILAAIDRGSLPDWRRIAAAVRASPLGLVTADLEQALEVAEDRGVAATLRRIAAHARQELEQASRDQADRRRAGV